MTFRNVYLDLPVISLISEPEVSITMVTLPTLLMLPMFHAVAALSHQVATEQQHHLVACVEIIIRRHFAPGEILLFSASSAGNTKRSFRSLHNNRNEFKLSDTMLENINKEATWPVLTSQTDSPMYQYESPYKHHGYVIFVSPLRGTCDVLNSLGKHLNRLELYKDSWNRRGKFIVAVLKCVATSARSLATRMIGMMWNKNRTVNVLIILPGTHSDATDKTEYPTLDVYTWFPYDFGQCRQVKEVVPLDQWVIHKKGNFINNAFLFPRKAPNNLQSCPIRVSTEEVLPYVMIVANKDGDNSNETYTFEGYEIECLNLLSKAMNMTLVFRVPRQGDFQNSREEMLRNVSKGLSDVTIGSLGITTNFVSLGDPTIPHLYTAVRWWVPCARPVSRAENVFRVFTASVWSLMFLVTILTALTFWRIAQGPSHSALIESNSYRTISYSLYNVWAVSFCVSVTEVPRTSRLRAIFFLFVCYSFAINTVFQSFFTSFLIEPGYEKQIRTLEELSASGITHAQDPKFLSMIESQGFMGNVSVKLSTNICSSNPDCLVYLIKRNNVTTIASKFLADYILSTQGRSITEYRNKYLCSVDENIETVKFSTYLAKGDPLLDRFNVWVLRSLETGLLEHYWSQLIWNTSLQNAATSALSDTESNPAGSDMYFAFTTFHLRIAIYIFLLGCFMSCGTFLVELILKL